MRLVGGGWVRLRAWWVAGACTRTVRHQKCGRERGGHLPMRAGTLWSTRTSGGGPGNRSRITGTKHLRYTYLTGCGGGSSVLGERSLSG
jgi:hypothetical protein